MIIKCKFAVASQIISFEELTARVEVSSAASNGEPFPVRHEGEVDYVAQKIKFQWLKLVE